MRNNEKKTQHKNAKLRKIKMNCTVKGEIRNYKNLNGESNNEVDRKEDDWGDKYDVRDDCE